MDEWLALLNGQSFLRYYNNIHMSSLASASKMAIFHALLVYSVMRAWTTFLNQVFFHFVYDTRNNAKTLYRATALGKCYLWARAIIVPSDPIRAFSLTVD